MQLSLTLEEVVWIAQILKTYQDDHGKDFTANRICRKLDIFIGDIRVAPALYALTIDQSLIPELGEVADPRILIDDIVEDRR